MFQYQIRFEQLSQVISQFIFTVSEYLYSTINSLNLFDIVQTYQTIQMQSGPLVFPKKEMIQQFIRKYLVIPGGDSLKPNVVSLEYVNNSTYVGEAIDEMKQGKGVYQYSSGDVYAGNWENDTFQGEGAYVFANGQFFTGKFKDGHSTKGVYYYLSGNIYVGDFVEFKKDGQGRMTYLQQAAQYQGQWKNGEKHGYGIYKCADYGYEGSWNSGKKTGKCKIEGKDINFTGQALNNKLFKGIIQIKFPNGHSYQGQISQGLKDGRGIYQFSNILKYTGGFENDAITGMGKATYDNGQYEGNFIDGQRMGSGVYIYNNGTRYQGRWENNVRGSFGVVNFSNGDSYQGQFLSGKKHGKGKYTYKDGSVFDGDFQNGLRSGFGKLTDNNFWYKGQWMNDQMHGEGVINDTPVLMKNNQVEKVLN